MLKKFLSGLCAVLVVAVSMPSVFAVAPTNANLVNSVSLTVDGSNLYYFEPSNGQVLNVNVTLNTTDFAGELASSSGIVEIQKNDKVIKTLYPQWDLTVSGTFSDLLTSLSTLTWDGKSIDDTADAKSACGSIGAVCPDGDYIVRVYVGTPKYYNDYMRYFGVRPNIYTENLVATPASFNPYAQTSDISFTLVGDGFVTVKVVEWGEEDYVVKNTLIDNKSLTAGNYTKTQEPTLSWDGKDSSGNILPNKEYTVRTTTKQTASGADIHEDYTYITVNSPTTLALTSFTSIPTLAGGSFDPSASGNNEDLTTAYTLAAPADSVVVEIKNQYNTPVKSFTAGTIAEKTTASFQWDGTYAGHLVEPGTYTATLTAKKAGEVDLVSSKTVTVAYSNANRPAFDSVTVIPSSFDPDIEDSIVTFRNTKDAELTLEIRNNTGAIRTFSDYDRDSFNANQTHSVAWNGKDTSGSYVSLASYKVVILAENAYGVTKEEKDVAVNNSGGTVSSSNAHVGDISVSPSSKFEPANDEELKIKFDVDQDLDSLLVQAVRGTDVVELYNETSIDSENNLEIYWDGTDDNGDYADAGSWKIMFKSKKGSTSLTASKSIEVSYDKPAISDLYVSKDKFDNDLGEHTNVLFRLKNDAKVDIVIMQGGSDDDTIEEDMEIVKNTWYAVEWDGGNYDYNDTISIKLVAKNTVNDNVYDSAKVSVDLAEDTDSSSKSNVTNDYITPVVTGGNDSMTLNFELEETADVTITIHKGKSSSGSVIATLLDNVQDMAGGSQEILWNGKDKNGKTLSKDLYTYKIVSKDKSTETETGLFVVGVVGDISASSSGSSSSSSGVSSNVTIVTGGNTEPTPVTPVTPTTTPTTTPSSDCSKFSDVTGSNQYCDAIAWASANNIFNGYSDGSFKPYQTINRVELLKVVIEAFGLVLEADDGTDLGFKDVIKGSWYMKYVKTAKNKGIFAGDSGKGTARPDAVINRAEAIKLIFETAKAMGLSYSPNGSTYSDVKAGTWYETYAALASKFGLFDGSNLYPANLMSRGEVAQVLYRLMK